MPRAAAGPSRRPRVLTDSYSAPRPRRPERDPRLQTRLELEGRSLFPVGPRWELTRTNTGAWLLHNFWGWRGETGFARAFGEFVGSEIGLLLLDLDCFVGIWDRWITRNWVRHRLWERPAHRVLPPCPDDPRPPYLEEYLAESRENWGMLARLLREWDAAEAEGAEEAEQAAEESGAGGRG